jgi:uncharacterized protein (TIGR02246 family)
MEKLAVERTIWIAAPRERAWRAVTEPEQLNRWYATYYHWHIPALQVGATVKFYNKDDETDMQLATIEVVDPPRQFTLRWQPDREYPAMTLVTTFRLKEENGGTSVTISESGYEAMPAEARQRWLEAVGQGYSMSVENLKAHVEGRTDEAAIRSLYQQLLAGWNKRSAHDFAAPFAENGHVVSFDGSQYNGRAEIEAEIGQIFADHLTAAYVWKIREARFLTPEVALLRAVAGMRPPGQSELNPAANAIQTLVAARREGEWRIALFQNTPAQFHGRPELSEALTAELRQLL